MSGFKGMPGPWRAVDKRPYSDGFSIFSGNQYVAFVGDSDGVTDYLSNANLIAAAPELLEACLRMRNQLYAAGYEAEKDSLNPTKCLLAQVESAIAKALGNN